MVLSKLSSAIQCMPQQHNVYYMVSCQPPVTLHPAPHRRRRVAGSGHPVTCGSRQLAAWGMPSSQTWRAPCKTSLALARRAADVRLATLRPARRRQCASRRAFVGSASWGTPSAAVDCGARCKSPSARSAALCDLQAVGGALCVACGLQHCAAGRRGDVLQGTLRTAVATASSMLRGAPPPLACPTDGSTAPAEGAAGVPAGIPASSAPSGATSGGSLPQYARAPLVD
ncbi:hypothetical protein BC834DRAFT_76044 [Gloeopeniophorella convolvens]|nr:hypothetical protein BC834DRAFT_76044 [Gloeopeniophorella convolvens]